MASDAGGTRISTVLVRCGEEPQFAEVFGTSLASPDKQNLSLLAIGPGDTSANMVVEQGSGSQTLTAAQLKTVYSA
jgi:hypothetical protein